MEKKLKRVSELDFFRRVTVKVINKIQKLTLKLSLNSLYLKLFKLHFKVYLGKSLLEEVLNGTYEGKAAVRRHGRLVVKTFFNDKSMETKEKLYKAAKNAFKKDIILEAKL